jgi:hypothetical protein
MGGRDPLMRVPSYFDVSLLFWGPAGSTAVELVSNESGHMIFALVVADPKLLGIHLGEDCPAHDAGIVTEFRRNDLDALGGAAHGIVHRGFNDDGHHLV